MSKKRYTAREVIDAIELSEGVIVQAADILGCERSTVYDYIEEFVTVKDALHRARRGLVAEAQHALVNMMRDATHREHYKAVKDILLTFDRETDWSEKQRRSHDFGQIDRLLAQLDSGDDTYEPPN